MKAFPILFLVAIFFSCENDQGVTVRLTSRERTKIDTLYAESNKVLRPQWDSICEARHDSILNFAVDSIVSARLIEEIKLRERMLQAAQEQNTE